MMKRNNKFNKKERPVAKNCPFCAMKTVPDYKDVNTLYKYITERGKILGRSRNGLCSKHQRGLTIAIKQARHVAMLPYLVRA